MVGLKFQICGYGACLPARQVQNADLAGELGVHETWIERRLSHTFSLCCRRGNHSHPGCRGSSKGNRHGARYPARPRHLQHLYAGVFPVPDCSGDRTRSWTFNARRNRSQRRMCGGIVGIFTSLSFLFAGAARTVLLVSADTTTRFLARRHTQTRILFGDGAAAFVLQAARFDGSRVRSYTCGSDGAGAPLFRLETCEDGSTHAKPGCHSRFGCLRHAAVKMDGAVIVPLCR